MKYKFLLLCISLLGFCSIVSGQYKLNFNLTGMDQHIGEQFEVRVTDKENGQEVAREILPFIQNGSFFFEFVALKQGHSYHLDFYTDVSRNFMYDPPLIDHAWRLSVDTVLNDRVVNFIRNTSFFDIEFPGPVEPGYYDANWAGIWQNLTFGSSDSIQVHMQIDCDSIHIHIQTKGLFGNPDTVQIDIWDSKPNIFGGSTDTFIYEIEEPLQGSIMVYNGHFMGSLVHPDFLVGLDFNGNFGTQQMMANYTVLNAIGTPFANGYFYSNERMVVANNDPIQVQLIELDSVSCNMGDNGQATVLATGGNPPYVYSWSSGGSGSVISISAGSYDVTATDASGCQDTLSFSIGEPDPIKIDLVELDSVSCNGDNDGIVEIVASGGIPNYVYLWSNSRTGARQENLEAGVYSVTVTDANACTSDSVFTVTQPDSLRATATSTDESALDAMDGTARVSAIGGTKPYNYLWSTNDTAANLTGLSPGEYTVTTTDVNGCQDVKTVRIAEYICLLETVILGTDTICADSTTSLFAAVASGTPPYTFQWNTGSMQQTINFAHGGDYNVLVTDQKNCVAMDSFELEQLPTINIMLTIEHESAFEAMDGMATANVTGGVPPYTFNWSNGSMENMIEDLPPGMHSLEVTDAFGCRSSTNFIIQEYDCSIVIDSIEVTHEMGGNGNGAIEITFSGGMSPFTYNWSKDGLPFAMVKDLVDISAGTYVVTIQDEKGCMTTSGEIIVENISSTVEISSHFSIFPNPASEWIKVETDIQNWSLNLFDIHGKLILNASEKNGGHKFDLEYVPSGIYYAIINSGKKKEIKKILINSN